MSYENNSWDFIRYSRKNWKKYLVFALHDLYHLKEPFLAYVSSEEKKSAFDVEVLIDYMIALAPKKPEEYADWFKVMSGTKLVGRLEDSEWAFMKELIADIYDVSWGFERESFIKALLKDDVLPEESTTSSRSVVKEIIGVFIEKKDIAELALRVADFIQMDLLTCNNSMGAVSNSMKMDGGKVLRLRKAFGYHKLSWGVLGILFDGYYSIIAPNSYRKKKNRLLLLCLVYLRNSYVRLSEITSFSDAVREILRQNREEQRKAAALAYFEQIYDDFCREKVWAMDKGSLAYQVFCALKDKYSIQDLFGEHKLKQGEHAETSEVLLEEINKNKRNVYEQANERIWREIAEWKKKNNTHPKVLLVDYVFPFITFDNDFVIEPKERGNWDNLSDEVSRQFVDMEINKQGLHFNIESIYRKPEQGEQFDIILLKAPEQDVQKKYVEFLSSNPDGQFLYTMDTSKLRKEFVITEMGSLIHRLKYFFTTSAQAIKQLTKTISRPGKEQKYPMVESSKIARNLYIVLDSFDVISNNLKLKKFTVLGAPPDLTPTQLQPLITDYAESRGNLFHYEWEALEVANNLLPSTVSSINKADLYAVMDELLKNARKYAFNDSVDKLDRIVFIQAKNVLFKGEHHALITIGDKGVGCSLSEADYFKAGKTTSGTGQGGYDILSTINAFNGHCHLRSHDELEGSWHFMLDILLPVERTNEPIDKLDIYTLTTFEK